ncbi:MAG TPA: NADH-quinone oxidoreductase subunit C [Chitinophagaceae bacterium]|nr:NADH-quinone oxidoreductase subunit C [Chitinophagaceae bacterium]HQV07074.1 NADH-quinone oxidoreductase subunit C [Chitinophagaceae bacterium]
MTQEELKIKITEILPEATIEEGGDWPSFDLPAEKWLTAAETLRQQASLQMDFLFCLTCIDWKTHLTMVYHLRSTTSQQNIVIKIKLDTAKPEIESVAHIWRTAEFHEREVYEMFGVNFLHHPDLRLLILPDGWEGKNPLRKDFEDPVNMIKL